MEARQIEREAGEAVRFGGEELGQGAGVRGLYRGPGLVFVHERALRGAA